MKAALFGTVIASLCDSIFAHYAFGHLWINGTRSEKWQYIREVAPNPEWGGNLSVPAEAQHAQTYPVKDIHSAPMTCGLDAFKSASQTQTATVVAGSVVAFEPANLYSGSAAEIYHWGPASAWLSRAPNDDVDNYEGLGDWFKIAYWGPSDNVTWSAHGMKIANFTIPKATPPGKYLLRFEHLRPFSVPEIAELYINCAQVNIVGPGGGVPSGFARFPGTYEWSDPGIYILKEWDYNLVYPGVTYGGLLNYVPPGPPTWTG